MTVTSRVEVQMVPVPEIGKTLSSLCTEIPGTAIHAIQGLGLLESLAAYNLPNFCLAKIVLMCGIPGPSDVLIKMNATGICQSDLHFMMGDWGMGFMSAQGTKCAGHEGAGVIVKIGDQVKNLKVGQRAGFKPVADTCGMCDLCRTDKECYCYKALFTGFHTDGKESQVSLSTYV